MNEKVIAIKANDKVVSVNYGHWNFTVTENVLEKNSQLEGFYAQMSKENLKKYLAAFELCQMAFENDMYDEERN